MDPLKFPVVGTILLFSLAGMLTFFAPLSPRMVLADITSGSTANS